MKLSSARPMNKPCPLPRSETRRRSGLRLDIAPIATESKTPQLSIAPVGVPPDQERWVFRLPQGFTVMAHPIVEHMKKTGIKTPADLAGKKLGAPVFDADGHLVLGVVAMGSSATLETDWQGPVAKALRAFAAQLSADLGWLNR